jgi:hypothetical protein
MSWSPCADLKKTLSVAVWLPVLIGLLLPTAAYAYTPESPEVQEMLKRAVGYLTSQPSTHGPGGDALIALALYKAGVEPSNAKIRGGIEAAKAWAQSSAKDMGGSQTYTPALCFMLLAEVDPDGSQEQLNLLLQSILARQRPSGSWSYYPPSYDDTSQAQYGLLCLWAAHHMGMAIPVDAVERAAAWFVRTQRPGGGWCYAPEGGYTDVTHSMSAAAGSSLYVCAHILGFMAQQPEDPKSGLPPALVKVETEEDRKVKRLRPQYTTPQTLSPGVNGANNWFAKNLNYDTKKWTHYYMYGLERYMSFRDLVESNKNPEPAWYNQGVEFLKKTQRDDGSWQTEQGHGGAVADTAFAVLFLTRSSQKMIQKAVIEEGILRGGHGLPKDLTNARLQDGKVVTPQMVRDVDDLLELIKDAEDKDFDALALPGGLSLHNDLTKRTSQLERLRSLVTNADFNARLAAVKTLARSHELDNVPALIYALSDSDPRIVREANNGLRFISRKFRGPELSDTPTDAQKQAAEATWKEWFLSIRPDAEFLE